VTDAERAQAVLPLFLESQLPSAVGPAPERFASPQAGLVQTALVQAGLVQTARPSLRVARDVEARATERESTTLDCVVKQDAVAWLRGLPRESVDLVVTDPAYESLEKHRAVGTTTRLKRSKGSSNDWFQVFPNERFPEFFAQIHRVLKRDTHFYLFCDQETMFVVKPMAEAVGFKFWKPLVWDKQHIGMGYHYRSRYEFILFFEKGKRRLLDLSIPDVLSHTRIHRGYPAEKPSGVSEQLIRQSSDPGGLVIDPFAGSGSVGVAARQLGRRFLGCDICDEAVRISNERVPASSDPVESE
jgi:site-specific DNA-methyltransferase (adenine-specific)